MRRSPIAPSKDVAPGWRRVALFAVGGLTDVGFSTDEAYVLIASHSGRGVVSTASGELVARDDTFPEASDPWRSTDSRRVRGIGRLADADVEMHGLWGSELVQHTADAAVVVEKAGERVSLKVARRDYVIDRPVTEIRAVGFSASGRHLVLATSSDLTLLHRVVT